MLYYIGILYYTHANASFTVITIASTSNVDTKINSYCSLFYLNFIFYLNQIFSKGFFTHA